ncbi:hypothetical protein MLD38_020775 [Melastoma candidum]|uniref:Uncharacterized protein n=1 Tax=Melastoma candidum TaxID=119954 RepID=A0ACB9QE45_9MYRT|nr:hypothetical protein MLD38_020775 [Melastoma candidum]
MGFPLGYTEAFTPGLFLHLLFFLGHVRSLVLALFDSAGLSGFLDPPADAAAFHVRASHPPKPVRDAIPVVRYHELEDPPESCAVCLCEFEGGDEIRWLSGCRHVFHLPCLDRWLDCDQDTCPMCRTRILAADGIGYERPEPLLCW